MEFLLSALLGLLAASSWYPTAQIVHLVKRHVANGIQSKRSAFS